MSSIEVDQFMGVLSELMNAHFEAIPKNYLLRVAFFIFGV